jgi:hypothetical protein
MERACVPILPDNNPLPHAATRDATRRGGGCGTGRVLEATEQKEGPSPWWMSLESQPGMASTATNPFSVLPIFRIKAPRSLPTCNPVCFCKASLWWLEKTQDRRRRTRRDPAARDLGCGLAASTSQIPANEAGTNTVQLPPDSPPARLYAACQRQVEDASRKGDWLLTSGSQRRLVY